MEYVSLTSSRQTNKLTRKHRKNYSTCYVLESHWRDVRNSEPSGEVYSAGAVCSGSDSEPDREVYSTGAVCSGSNSEPGGEVYSTGEVCSGSNNEPGGEVSSTGAVCSGSSSGSSIHLRQDPDTGQLQSRP